MSSPTRSTSQAARYRALQKSQRRARLHCVNGCGRGKPDANFCVNCGTRLPVAAEKAARSVPQPAEVRDPLALNQGAWRDEAFRDPDPTVRELAWQAHFDAFTRGR